MNVVTATKERGFRFFFWLSASLFLLAAANWTFGTFIGISGLASFLWGIVILLLSILLVATLLMSAYHGVSNVRQILDGLLGLDKEQTSRAVQTNEDAKGTQLNATKATQPGDAALIAEYQSLSLFINSRRNVQMTINSITLTGAVGILGLVLTRTPELGSLAGWVALFPIPLILLAWINWRALVLLDNQTYSRLDEVEDSLGISGHREIHKKLRDRWLIKARYKYWDIFYALVLGLSFVTSAYLFGVRV